MNAKPNEPAYRGMMNCVASNIREYGIERSLTPQQFSDIFHTGIAAIAEKYPANDPLKIAVMAGAVVSERLVDDMQWHRAAGEKNPARGGIENP